jgi:hypothetical protein
VSEIALQRGFNVDHLAFVKRGFRAASCLLCFIAVVPGCGSSDSSSGGEQPVPVEAFPDSFANASCDNLGKCCQAAALPFDLETCKAEGRDYAMMLLEYGTPRTKYDATAAGRCIAAIARVEQSCESDPSGVVDKACGSLLVGIQPLGAACNDPLDCAQPASGTVTCGPGTCVVDPTAPVHSKVGEPCVATCHDGTAECSGAAGAGFCHTEDGLWCDLTTASCKTQLANGEPCQSSDSCSGGSCMPANSAASTSVCSAQPLANEGTCSVYFN